MLDIMFDAWFEEYVKQHSIIVEQFRGPLYRAFVDGWLECEKFYE